MKACLLVILAALFLSSVISALTHAQEDELSTREKVYANSGGLSIWAGIGSGIRGMFPSSSEFNKLDISLIPTGLFIFIGLIVISIIVSLGVCCGLSICRCACARRNPNGYSKSKKIVVQVLLGIAGFAFIVFMITGIRSVNVVKDSIPYFGSASNDTMNDIVSFTTDLGPTVYETFAKFDTGLDSLMTSIKDLVSTIWTSPDSIFSDIQSIDKSLETLNATISEVLNVGDNQVQASIYRLQQDAIDLQNNYQAIVDKINEINAPNKVGTKTVTLKNPIVAPAFDGVPANLKSMTNISAELDVLRPPQLPSLSETSQKILDEFEAALNNSIKTVSDLETDLKAQSATQNADVQKLVGDLSVQVSDQMEPYSVQINEGVKSAIKFYGYSYIAFSVFFIFPVMIFALIMLLTKFNKPRTINCCALCSNLLWILFLILSIAVFLPTYILGTGCEEVFTKKGENLASLSIDLPKYINAYDTISTNCASGTPFLLVLSKINDTLNLNMDDFNITLIINNNVEKVDWNVIVNQINSSDIVTTDILSKISSIDPTSYKASIEDLLNMKELDPVKEPIPTDNDKTGITNLKSSLTTMKTGFDSGIAYNWDNAPTAADIAAANSLFNGQVTEVESLINTGFDATDSIVVQLNNERTTLTGNLGILNTTVGTLQEEYDAAVVEIEAMMNRIPSFVNATKITITEDIPKFISDAKAIGSDIQKYLETNITCTALGEDLQTMENLACAFLLMGLDGLWLTFLVCGWTGIGCIAVYYVASNRLAHKSDKTESMGDTYPVNDAEKGDISKNMNESYGTKPIPSNIIKTAPADDENDLPKRRSSLRPPSNDSNDPSRSSIRRPSVHFEDNNDVAKHNRPSYPNAEPQNNVSEGRRSTNSVHPMPYEI